MDDLITFLIIIGAIVVNLLRLRKDKRPKQQPGNPSRDAPPTQHPSPLEEFFGEIARKFEPQPRNLPEWPENMERPDYAQEMEEYEATHMVPPPEVPVTKTMPRIPEVKAPEIPHLEVRDGVFKPKAVAKTAFKIKSQNISMAGSSGSHIRVPPLLRSATGRTHFELKTRGQLKQALIASMVFGPPRAYEQTFHNTLAE